MLDRPRPDVMPAESLISGLKGLRGYSLSGDAGIATSL
jgi:hypothetical protein